MGGERNQREESMVQKHHMISQKNKVPGWEKVTLSLEVGKKSGGGLRGGGKLARRGKREK